VGHGEMTLIGAIGYSLLCSVCDNCVSMGHSESKLIGGIRNSLLYSVVDK